MVVTDCLELIWSPMALSKLQWEAIKKRFMISWCKQINYRAHLKKKRKKKASAQTVCSIYSKCFQTLAPTCKLSKIPHTPRATCSTVPFKMAEPECDLSCSKVWSIWDQTVLFVLSIRSPHPSHIKASWQMLCFSIPYQCVIFLAAGSSFRFSLNQSRRFSFPPPGWPHGQLEKPPSKNSNRAKVCVYLFKGK